MKASKGLIGLICAFAVAASVLTVGMAVSAQSNPDWTVNNGNPSITGDSDSGYKMEFSSAAAPGQNGVEMTCKNEFDVKTQKVKLKFSTTNAWVSFALKKSDNSVIKGFYLYLHDAQSGTGKDLRVALMSNPNANANIIRDFDLSAEHTLTFEENAGKWYLKIDDLLCSEPETGDAQGYECTGELEGAEYKGYIALGTEASLNADIKFEKSAPTNVADWTVNSGKPVITGDTDNGYNIAFSSSAAPGLNGVDITYNTISNVKKDSFKIKFTTTNSWIYIGLKNSDKQVIKGFYLYLHDSEGITGKDLRIAPLNNPNGNKNIIKDFDLSVEHIIKFAQSEGRWYLKVDDLLCDESATSEAQGYECTGELEAVDFSGYFTIASEASLNATVFFEKERPVVNNFWNIVKGNPEITGDDANGYHIQFSSDAAPGENGLEIVSKSEIDIKNYALKLRFKTTNQWISLSLKDKDGDPVTGFYFYLHDAKSGTGKDLRVAPFVNPGANANIIRNFNFDAEHIIKFTEVNGKWYLQVDDRICSDPASEAQGYEVTDELKMHNYKGFIGIGTEAELAADVKLTTDFPTDTVKVSQNQSSESIPATGDNAPVLAMLSLLAVGICGISVSKKLTR